MKQGICIALLIVLAACRSETPPPDGSGSASAGPESDIRLVLVIAVDQLRGDYLDRFAPVLDKGLAWLVDKGVWFDDGHQDHAVTNTGPGHASISTGVYPSRSGIISNNWFDKQTDSLMYCVADSNAPLIGAAPGSGRSPNNLQVTAYPDWLQERWPQSRAFSASYKDRAAILLGGKSPDGAYWYHGATGNFVTSTYYQRTYPSWVEGFAARRLPDQFFGTLWEPLPVAPEIRHALGIESNDTGWYDTGFPHAIGGHQLRPGSPFYSRFGATPMVDQYLVEFTKAMITSEKVGQGAAPDYLAVSFSALDLVGHDYGPNSPEVLDTMMRLDHSVKDLLDFIDREIGLDKVVIAFSSDHGVAQLPEYRKAHGQDGHRSGSRDTVCIQNWMARLSERLEQDIDWFSHTGYLNDALIADVGLDPSQVAREAAKVLAECDLYEKFWTRQELLQPSDDPMHRLFANSFHLERGPDLMPQLKENSIIKTGQGSTHGSPYRYDTHVPILFVAPGIDANRVSQRTATIDIAPTLADLTDLDIPPHVQGRSLVEWMGN